MRIYATTVAGWHEACGWCAYPFDDGDTAFATDPDPAFASDVFCGRTCATNHERREADKLAGLTPARARGYVASQSGTIRPATLVGLVLALVPITLLLTFSARLAGMLAGTVGGVA